LNPDLSIGGPTH